jgi:hypothetical protein
MSLISRDEVQVERARRVDRRRWLGLSEAREEAHG